MGNIIVPQFIDAEDTIIGPITIRQFIEMLIGGMLCFIYYKLFDFSLFVVASLVTVGLSLVIAFVKVNGQNFHDFLLNFFATLKNPKLKIWKREVDKADIKMVGKEKNKDEKPKDPTKPVFAASGLSELALIVDTGGVYGGETVLSREQINSVNQK